MVDQNLRFDPEELDDPLPVANGERLAETEGLAHLLFDFGRDSQGNLRHRVAGREFEKEKNDQADEQQGRYR